MPLNILSSHSLNPYCGLDTMLGIIKGRINKKTLCPSCILQRKAAMETELLYSVRNAQVEIAAQYGADTKGKNLTWQERFLCREHKMWAGIKV